MGKPELVDYFANKSSTSGQSNPVYAAMVASLDENVGKLLETLDRLGLGDNTLVIFTSDNGGIRAVSDQSPLRAGKGSYYEGGIRIPMVMRWPGKIREGLKNDQPVSHLDLYPTIQEIIQLDPSGVQFDGQSLVPQFAELNYVGRDLFFHFPIYLEAYRPKKDDGRDPLFRTRPGSVVISWPWKLHEYYEDGGLELYNLEEDPGERRNLINEAPNQLSVLQQKLKNWRAQTGAPVPTKLNPEFDSAWEAQRQAAVRE
jgi:arylsulfatase A-like enzyme